MPKGLSHQVVGQRKRRRVRFLAVVNDWKVKRGACCDCGMAVGDEPYLFDFDHRDPAMKSFDVSQGNHRPIAALEAEIAKCDLRCAICHRRRTAAEKHWRRKSKLRSVPVLQPSLFDDEVA